MGESKLDCWCPPSGTSKFTNGEGVGLKSRTKFLGSWASNLGVAVGVRGDADSRLLCPESVSRPGGLPPDPAAACWGCVRFGAIDVALESNPDLDCASSLRYSSSTTSTTSTLGLDAFLAVPLESFDFVDTFDRSSLITFGRPNHDLSDPRELGLDPFASSSLIFAALAGVDVLLFLCADNSVSGGVSGPSLFRLSCDPLAPFASKLSLDPLGLFAFKLSCDPLALCASISVGSGVYTSGLFRSTLLYTASLLCALLKLGYGKLSLLAPGADAVLDSSGTRSAIDALGSDSTLISPPFSFSFSFSRLRLRTGSPVSGSIGRGLEERGFLGLLGSRSRFSRVRRSEGRSLGSMADSAARDDDIMSVGCVASVIERPGCGGSGRRLGGAGCGSCGAHGLPLCAVMKHSRWWMSGR